MFPINHSNGTVNEGGVNPFKVRVGEDIVPWRVGEVSGKKPTKIHFLTAKTFFSLQLLTDPLSMKSGTS